MIYDADGIFVGWQPYSQYDLSAEEDSLHCTYSNSSNCDGKNSRGHAIKGQDPYSPWFSLGSDTGFDLIRLDEPYVVDGDSFQYVFEDADVVDGLEYTYSIVAYDMGVEPPYKTVYEPIGDGQFNAVVDTNYSNPDQWANPEGYTYIENSKGTTILDRNFVQVYPGVQPQTSLKNVGVVPNPYIVRSGHNETTFNRKIKFNNLPSQCMISIYTVTGELVSEFEHQSITNGYAWWDMRTVNNQEVAPGLYVFHIKGAGEEKVGKFAVIR
jgi:hypothetical protein